MDKKYEYRVVTPGSINAKCNQLGTECLERELNELGSSGWRLVFTLGDVLILEREKQYSSEEVPDALFPVNASGTYPASKM